MYATRRRPIASVQTLAPHLLAMPISPCGLGIFFLTISRLREQRRVEPEFVERIDVLATILHGPRDLRCEEVSEPKILKPTDAVIRLLATCICGSDLWPFRGLNEISAPMALARPS